MLVLNKGNKQISVALMGKVEKRNLRKHEKDRRKNRGTKKVVIII